MSLQLEFKNFIPALMFYIEDKNPSLGSNDSKSICFFLSLRNLKKAFDYYELVKTVDRGVYFRIYTMNGFKQILETQSEVFYNDMEIIDWQNLIYEITMSHFMKEEYLALKKGYVKTSSGCLVLLGVIFGINIYMFF